MVPIPRVYVIITKAIILLPRTYVIITKAIVLLRRAYVTITRFDYPVYTLLDFLLHEIFFYLIFQSFEFERTQWRLSNLSIYMYLRLVKTAVT